MLRVFGQYFFGLVGKRNIFNIDRVHSEVVANGHTSSNTPDPIRTRKLSGERPGQYWGGGPPGKPLGCCWLFLFLRKQVIFACSHPSKALPNGFNNQKCKTCSSHLSSVSDVTIVDLTDSAWSTYLAGVGPRSSRWLSIG